MCVRGLGGGITTCEPCSASSSCRMNCVAARSRSSADHASSHGNGSRSTRLRARACAAVSVAVGAVWVRGPRPPRGN